jgi:hypothetical protein
VRLESWKRNRSGCRPHTGLRWLSVTRFGKILEAEKIHTPLISVYVALTDGRGKTPVKLQLLGADEEDGVLFEGEMEIEWQDPRMVVELTFAMANITFPRPGEYRFCLFGANEFILERRILIRQFTAKE